MVKFISRSNTVLMSDPSARLSCEDLLDILSLSHNATAIYTTHDVIIESANNAMLKFWGKGKEIIGMPLAEGVPALNGQPFIGMLQSVWETGNTIEGKDTPATLEIDGKLQTSYYDFSYRAIKNADGTIRCVLHTATDVSERYISNKRIEEMNAEVEAVNKELYEANKQLVVTNQELAESQDTLLVLNDNLTDSESQLQFAIDAANLGTWDLDPKNFRFTGNDRLKSWFGIRADEDIELNNAVSAIAETDRHRVITAINKALDQLSGGKYDIEYTIINPLDGRQRIVRAKGKALFNVDNEAIRLSGTLQDVTEERKARELLTETNQRLEMALDAGKLGSYDLDIDTGVMHVTHQHKLNFGWPQDAPFNYNDLLNAALPDYRKRIDKHIKNALAHNVNYQSEFEIQWPDGTKHWISASGKPRYNDKGKAVRLVGITYDITETKNNEQRKDDFISIASHELKTPITTLKSSLQLLNRMKDSPSPVMFPKLIEQSNRSMDRISSLIEDLLNVSRMNEGQLHLNKSTFVIADLLSQCCNHVRATGKFELVIEGDTQLQITADEHRIDQVIINLVNNAVKYAPNSPDIHLIVEREDNMAKISVKDFGPGIAPDKLPHLFDRYYRADYSGIQYSGLGLGLYICSEIVRKHDGTIGAVSEPGKGSTFWFKLPL